jgi:hypothetical protein
MGIRIRSLRRAKDQNRPAYRFTRNARPDDRVIKVARPAFKNKLLSNLVAIPIIPEGTVGQQKDNRRIGSV